MTTVRQNQIIAERDALEADYLSRLAQYKASISHYLELTPAELGALQGEVVAYTNQRNAAFNAIDASNPVSQSQLAAENAAYFTALAQWQRANSRINPDSAYLVWYAKAETAWKESYPRPLYRAQLAWEAEAQSQKDAWDATHPHPHDVFGSAQFATYNTLLAAWVDRESAILQAKVAPLKSEFDAISENTAASSAPAAQPPSNSAYSANYSGAQNSGAQGYGQSGGSLLPQGSIPVYGNASAGSGSQQVGGGQQIVGYMVPIAGTGVPVRGTTTTVVYDPGQPYIPPTQGVAGRATQITQDYNLGWNSGAASLAEITGPGYVEFSAPRGAVGVFVGLNLPQGRNSQGYADMPFAWKVSHGIAAVYEHGGYKYQYGPIGDNTLLRIQRNNDGSVHYLVNGNIEYSSAGRSYDYLIVDASLYSGGDWPTEFSIGVLEGASVSMEGAQGRGTGRVEAPYARSATAMRPFAGAGGRSATTYGQGANIALEPIASVGLGNYLQFSNSAINNLPPLTLRSVFAPYSSASLLPVTSIGADRIYGESMSSMAPFATQGGGGFVVPSIAIGDVAMAYMLGAGIGLTGGVGDSSDSLPALDGLASGSAYPGYAYSASNLAFLKSAGGRAATTFGNGANIVIEPLSKNPAVQWAYGGRSYGHSQTMLLPLSLESTSYEGGRNGFASSFVMVFDPWFASVVSARSGQSHVGIATSFDALVVRDADMRSTLFVSGFADAGGILAALMESRVQIGFDVPVYDDADGQAWVINEAGQTTKYEGYGFNSYGLFDGRYFGAKADGLYLLDGDTDSGASIRASINFGKKDFGSSAFKSVQACYLGVSADGEIYLKVTANDEEYIYRARNTSEVLETQRVDIGRGIRANYITFELFNGDGCDFELSRVEVLAAELSRRI